MVNQILSDPREGPSTYFQLVNFMFLQAKVAEAHRNRIKILVDRIESHVKARVDSSKIYKILTIGCGPAAEIEIALKKYPDLKNVEFTLLDFSEETLRFTSDKLNQIIKKNNQSVNIKTLQKSVHGLLKRSSKDDPVSEDEKYDYIYCAGLFDYLSEKVCVRLIDYFSSILKSNANILITNVHGNNPEKNWMEHFLEWHLIYRDESDMKNLMPQFYRNVECYTDNTGVNVFLEAVS